MLTGIPNGFIHDGGRLLFDDDGHALRLHRRDRRARAGSGPRVARRQGPADHPRRRPGSGQPRARARRCGPWGTATCRAWPSTTTGRLWATEFGEQTWDELNRIEKARNYGWPVVEGAGDQQEYRNPFVEWSTAEASPSGLAFLEGSLWAGALRGERLWQVPVTGDGVGEPRGWFVGDYGRIRTVAVSPEGTLWVTTSNRDGRGEPQPGDDRILELELR